MSEIKFINTNEKIEVANYPYGFKLRTTLFDYIEFDKKKGYRHVTQTINPKNGRLNAPKKSTYSALILRYYDEKNHIKTHHFSFNGTKELNHVCKVIAANFDMFNEVEINYFYQLAFEMAFVSLKSMAIYCGSNVDELKPLFDGFIQSAKKGIQDKGNYFGEMVLDIEALEKTKKENYQPFKVVEYGMN